MTHTFAAALTAIATLSAAAPALAGPQSLQGLTPREAAIVTYNAGLSPQDRQPLSIDRNGSPGLEAEAIAIYNAGKSWTDRQETAPVSGMAVPTRASGGGHTVNAQLIASAGLTAEEARGMTLGEIAAAKFNRNLSPQDRQRVGDSY